MLRRFDACASGATALHVGWLAVASGAADVALIVGAEKMTLSDRARTFAAIATALDVERAKEELGGEDLEVIAQERSPFMDIYAGLADRYLARSHATREDLARVSSKNHRHGMANPKAQYGMELSEQDVLASRSVSGPLTLYMCAPVGDGAAALVLCSEESVRSANSGRSPVTVAASVVVSGSAQSNLPPAQVRATNQAYEAAGLGPDEIDVAEVHDATAVAELIAYEELGFVMPGDGAGLLRSGATELGGRIPVNTSGGLLSKGHPIGATGVAQVVELVEQLRGTADGRQVPEARVGLAANEGGWIAGDVAAASVHIFVG